VDPLDEEELALWLEDNDVLTLGKLELREFSSHFNRNLYFCLRRMFVKKQAKTMKDTRKHAW